MLTESIKREFVPVGDDLIVLDPETGAWLCVNKECRSIIEYISQASDISDVYAKFPGIDPHEIAGLLHMLKESEERSADTKEEAEFEECRKFAPTLCILKLTEACNLRCSYCYIDAGGRHNRMMSRETGLLTVKKFLDMHSEDGLKSSIAFHGGEPLLNFELMREITGYLEPFRDKASLSVQTNATLITDEIAKFLKDNNISTGISFDGPKNMHDITRRFPNGESSFDLVIKGIETLRKYDIHFDVICVLNRFNAAHIGELFDFFVSNHIETFCLSPVQPNGRGKDEDGIWLTGDVLFDAYKILLDRIIEHNSSHSRDERIYDRTLTYLIHIIYSNERDYMCMRGPCGSAINILSFTVDGDIYGCDNFIGHEEFRIGSVYNGDIMEQVLYSPARAKSKSRSMNELKRCRNCIWRGLCGGVCYSADYCSGANGEEETVMCVFYKKMIPYLIKKISDDPEIPYLLDKHLKKIRYRKYYVDIDKDPDDMIDTETLEAIMKIHEADKNTMVCLCVRDLENCKELTEMLGKIKENGAVPAIMTVSPPEEDADLYKKIFEQGTMRIYFAADEGIDVLETARQFANVRKTFRESNTAFGIRISVSSLYDDEYLIKKIRDIIGENDVIELLNDVGEDYKIFNSVLDRIRAEGMERRVILPKIDKEKLSNDNCVFLIYQKDDEFYHIHVDTDCFTGKLLSGATDYFFSKHQPVSAM